MRIQEIRELHRRFLAEGGAAGHLMHLSDDPELTFADLKDVLSQAAQGRLENVTEKLDGVNLVFTWNPSEGGLRVARAGGEIKQGGLDAKSLAKKFWGRGNVLEAFNVGFDVLERAIAVLSPDVQEDVFRGGGRWYSLELIYSGLTNTISYDADNIVFHQSPVFEIGEDGNIQTVDGSAGVAVLDRNIEQMQAAVSNRNWRIRGPALIRLKKIADGTIADRAVAEIDAAMSSAGVSDDNTLQEYLYNMVVIEASDLGVDQDVVEAIAARIAKVPGAPTLTQIKKMVPKELASSVDDFVKAEKALKLGLMQPIEHAVHNMAIEVLKGLESALIADSEAEISRLRSKLSSAITAIEASGHAGAMDVLAREMGKLRSVENIGSPMEGIVFMFKGRAYKFTGAFAPAHQILSLFTFGRKDIPKEIFQSGRVRHGVLIKEGGHAVADVDSISMDELRATWPTLEEELVTLGVQEVHPIGTTWKKAKMGDIDLAGEYEGGRDELFDHAADLFGRDRVAKVGANILSFGFPIRDADGETGRFVQVDLMLGDPEYLRWSRYGPSPDPEHEEFSSFKGALRNILLNVILRFAANEEFAAEQTDDERMKYAIDFDKGLFLIRQSRRGQGGKQLKKWKTIEREFITQNPDQIAATIFGEESTLAGADLMTLEDLVTALRGSSRLGHMADDIIDTFVDEVEEISQHDSKMMGPDPQATITLLRRL